MPKFTNIYGLPEALVRAAENDGYSFEGDISTTTLIDAPRPHQLKKRHDAEITEDVSSRVWAMFGQGVHAILERAKAPGSLVEERFLATVEGWVVGGQIDVYVPDTRTLWDYKITKVRAVTKGTKAEWVAQGNVNRWLLAQQKKPLVVDRLINVAFLKDWEWFKATGKPQKNGIMYPERDVVLSPLPLWDLKDTEEYVKTRVRIHQQARLLPDHELPHCTDEERWDGIRCDKYCSAAAFCNQKNPDIEAVSA